jgi:hypothetical protein
MYLLAMCSGTNQEHYRTRHIAALISENTYHFVKEPMHFYLFRSVCL